MFHCASVDQIYLLLALAPQFSARHSADRDFSSSSVLGPELPPYPVEVRCIVVVVVDLVVVVVVVFGRGGGGGCLLLLLLLLLLSP